ncbi:MAG: hypothetical protein ED557_10040 [Balneola sp.]|nr:MAG: hypothetical protein ED557_10040 [Balneola sp.]
MILRRGAQDDLKRKEKMKVIKLILLITVLLAATHVHAQTEKKTEQVTLQLKWKHQFQFAGYYMAIEKGYYHDLGLEVTLLEAPDEGETLASVFEGEAQFGVTTSDILLLRSRGRKLVLLAPIFQRSAQVLVAKRESGIEKVSDIQGKRVAVEAYAADILAYLEMNGVTKSDFIQTGHSYSISELIDDEVDAITAYISDEPFLLQEAGVDYVIIQPEGMGYGFYGDVLFTTEEMIENNQDVVLQFREASLKGWEYAMSNIEETVDIIYEKYSTRHSKEHLLYEAEQMMDLIYPNRVNIGSSSTEKWGQILDAYKELGLLPKTESISGLRFQEYLPREKKD